MIGFAQVPFYQETFTFLFSIITLPIIKGKILLDFFIFFSIVSFASWLDKLRNLFLEEEEGAVEEDSNRIPVDYFHVPTKSAETFKINITNWKRSHCISKLLHPLDF